MSDASREGSIPESPNKNRRQINVPARYRTDYKEPDNSPKKRTSNVHIGRGRPSSPSKHLSALPSDSPVRADEVIEADSTAAHPPPPPSRPRLPVPIVAFSVRRLHAGSQSMAQFRQGLTRQPASEISDSLKENLRKLKNLLKLPLARRWVYCEFFYSCVDEELLLADNEFKTMLKQTFPNLKTRRLAKTEWRTIRKLIGKPRRFSAAFLDAERDALEHKRERIREIYEGTNLLQIDPKQEFSDLPQRLPRPLVVGMKVYARVRVPKDGVYVGTIDAVMHNSYRVTFDKDELHPAIISDSEVIAESRYELVPIAYFVEQSKATLPRSVASLANSPFNPTKFMPERLRQTDPVIAAQIRLQQQRKAEGRIPEREEKVGNFPVRMLVIIVKLAKLIEHKRVLIKQLCDLNAEAEKTNLVCDSYSSAFQDKYAKVAVELEQLNKLMSTYLSGIHDYYTQLLPQISEVTILSRPDAFRKISATHARQVVKHCNNGLSIKSKSAINLITMLTSLLLQVRNLGAEKSTPMDMDTLSESLKEIRSFISPGNVAAFQDCVEIHMKQIHNMMVNSS